MKITYKSLENKTYKQLSELCHSHGIRVKGKKSHLISLLLKKSESLSKRKVAKSVSSNGKRVIIPKVKSSATTSNAATTNSPPNTNLATGTNSTNVNSITNTTINSNSNLNNINSSINNGQEQTNDLDPDNEVISIRMNRHSCNGGELHASLIWNDIADLDLHVITPSQEHLYFGHKESKCGGWLDKDMNVNGESSEPIENVFFASAAPGHYKIYVHYFSCHTNSSDPRFQVKGRVVPFRVRLIRNGITSWFEGAIAPYGKIDCFEFDHQGKGGGSFGSFVVIPPSSTPSTFKELCEKNNVTYSQGNGYYALKRKEEISEIKDMILHNSVTDTFIIGHKDVCEALKQPINQRLVLSPEDLPPNTRLFTQSTSHNRKITDTHVLMKVSVKEALTHRQSDKYKFK